jgi:predicted Fe-Mo cluster-binding NifX family protein
MKTIIASLNEWEKYEIANNAARAPFFILLEDEKYIKSIKNPFTSWWWAGYAAAELLKNEWCELFIAWKIWWNLQNKLEEYWIKYEEK